VRDAVRADEVPARAARDHGELDAVESRDAVRDLVDGAVAADDDQQRRTVVDGAARERAELAGRVGEERVALQAPGRGTVRDLGPSPARRPVVGGRVDEEDRFVSANASRPR